MKKLNLTFVLAAIVLIAVACSSQKEIQSSNSEESTNTTYTADNTERVETPKYTSKIIEKQEPKIHVVQKGENLWEIAKIYGVTIKDIVETNNIEDSSLIKIKQELIIPNTKVE